jgi:pantetheine-phosphate adenylyltransferase
MDFDAMHVKYMDMWDTPLRFYHGPSHLQWMLDNMEDPNNTALAYFCLFHDIIYDPRSSNNEEKSAEFFVSIADQIDDLSSDEKVLVYDMILATKTHDVGDDPRIREAVELDMGILHSTFDGLLKYEAGIFKEYQYVPIDVYVEKRLGFLRSQRYRNPYNIDRLIDHIERKVYKVGIYPGSFNPFHIGHLDVLRKAERLFDKVIVVQAINPDKSSPKYELPRAIPNEKIYHDGLISDLFDGSEHAVYTMVRGIRNEYDIAAEMNYQAWVKEINSDIEFVHIFCDPQNVKISSSMLRSMIPFKDFDTSKYIV